MKITTTQETIDEIKKIVGAKADQPTNVRVYIAGMGWGGPSYGLSLDEKNETDLTDDSNGITFVMDKELHEKMGDFKVEFLGDGYRVAPVNQEPSDCSSCSGSC